MNDLPFDDPEKLLDQVVEILKEKGGIEDVDDLRKDVETIFIGRIYDLLERLVQKHDGTPPEDVMEKEFKYEIALFYKEMTETPDVIKSLSKIPDKAIEKDS